MLEDGMRMYTWEDEILVDEMKQIWSNSAQDLHHHSMYTSTRCTQIQNIHPL